MHGKKYLDMIEDEEVVIRRFKKFSEVKKTKMRNEDNRYKNKKKNKGRIKST